MDNCYINRDCLNIILEKIIVPYNGKLYKSLLYTCKYVVSYYEIKHSSLVEKFRKTNYSTIQEIKNIIFNDFFSYFLRDVRTEVPNSMQNICVNNTLDIIVLTNFYEYMNKKFHIPIRYLRLSFGKMFEFDEININNFPSKEDWYRKYIEYLWDYLDCDTGGKVVDVVQKIIHVNKFK